jgi:hypothetical protein
VVKAVLHRRRDELIRLCITCLARESVKHLVTVQTAGRHDNDDVSGVGFATISDVGRG